MCVTQCVTLELNISEAVLKQEYWIPGAKIKLYAKKFSDVFSSLDQNKLFVSESLPPLTQLAKWYKEPKKQFSDL